MAQQIAVVFFYRCRKSEEGLNLAAEQLHNNKIYHEEIASCIGYSSGTANSFS